MESGSVRVPLDKLRAMRRILILGSTGSIGVQALDVVDRSDDLEVVGMVGVELAAEPGVVAPVAGHCLVLHLDGA